MGRSYFLLLSNIGFIVLEHPLWRDPFVPSVDQNEISETMILEERSLRLFPAFVMDLVMWTGATRWSPLLVQVFYFQNLK